MSMLSSFLRKTGLNKPLKFVGKAAPYVAGAALIPGVGRALGGVASKIGLGGVASGIGKLGGGKLGGAIKSVGKYALKNPDLILGGLSAYEGLQKGRNADTMMDAAMNDPGLNPVRPDRSDTFSYRNPYSPAEAAIPSVGMRRRTV